MSENLDFSVKQEFDRNKLLSDATEIVLYADIPLSEQDVPEVDQQKQRATELLATLKQEQVRFSPRLEIIPITPTMFQNKNITSTITIQYDLSRNNYYYVSVPVTLFPKAGWAFHRVECAIEFCPEEAPNQLLPNTHDLFPDDAWINILSFGQELKLGLNEELRFQAQAGHGSGISDLLDDEAQAKIIASVEATSSLVLGPFAYHIRRSQVRARGRGDVRLFWRLDGNQYVDEEDIHLGIVLSVPKARKKSVSAIGALRAYHSFQTLSAEFKDWFQDFPAVLRSFFKGGLPVETTFTWEDIITPSNTD